MTTRKILFIFSSFAVLLFCSFFAFRHEVQAATYRALKVDYAHDATDGTSGDTDPANPCRVLPGDAIKTCDIDPGRTYGPVTGTLTWDSGFPSPLPAIGMGQPRLGYMPDTYPLGCVAASDYLGSTPGNSGVPTGFGGNRICEIAFNTSIADTGTAQYTFYASPGAPRGERYLIGLTSNGGSNTLEEDFYLRITPASPIITLSKFAAEVTYPADDSVSVMNTGGGTLDWRIRRPIPDWIKPDKMSGAGISSLNPQPVNLNFDPKQAHITINSAGQKISGAIQNSSTTYFDCTAPANCTAATPTNTVSSFIKNESLANILNVFAAPFLGDLVSVVKGQTPASQDYSVQYDVPGPTATLTADKTTVDAGKPVVLTWTSTNFNATNPIVSSETNFDTKNQGANGSVTLDPGPTQTTIYTIKIKGLSDADTNAANFKTASVKVDVTSIPPTPSAQPPTVSLYAIGRNGSPITPASELNITQGDEITFKWESSNANQSDPLHCSDGSSLSSNPACKAGANFSGPTKDNIKSGSVSLKPQQAGNYILGVRGNLADDSSPQNFAKATVKVGFLVPLIPLSLNSFAVNPIPPAQAVTTGYSANYTVNVERNGFDNPVNLSVSTDGIDSNPLPDARSRSSFSPASVSPGQQSVLTVSAASLTFPPSPLVPKTYYFNVVGTSGGATVKKQVSLEVGRVPPLSISNTTDPSKGNAFSIGDKWKLDLGASLEKNASVELCGKQTYPAGGSKDWGCSPVSTLLSSGSMSDSSGENTNLSNGAWTGSGTMQPGSEGAWDEWLELGGKVKSAHAAFTVASVASITLSITNTTVASRNPKFLQDDRWKLGISSNLPKETVFICRTKNSIAVGGGKICGTARSAGLAPATLEDGSWQATGKFTTSTIGVWRECAYVGGVLPDDCSSADTGGSKSNVINFSVAAAAGDSQFIILPPFASAKQGGSASFTAYYCPDPSDCPADLTKSINVTNDQDTTWTSGNPAVAVLNSASKGGVFNVPSSAAVDSTTEVRAHYAPEGGAAFDAAARLTVTSGGGGGGGSTNPNPCVSLDIVPYIATVAVGGTVQFEAYCYPPNFGNRFRITPSAQWPNDGTGVVQNIGRGGYKGLKLGTAYISVSYGGAVANLVTITVVEAGASSCEFGMSVNVLNVTSYISTPDNPYGGWYRTQNYITNPESLTVNIFYDGPGFTKPDSVELEALSVVPAGTVEFSPSSVPVKSAIPSAWGNLPQPTASQIILNGVPTIAAITIKGTPMKGSSQCGPPKTAVALLSSGNGGIRVNPSGAVLTRAHPSADFTACVAGPGGSCVDATGVASWLIGDNNIASGGLVQGADGKMKYRVSAGTTYGDTSLRAKLYVGDYINSQGNAVKQWPEASAAIQNASGTATGAQGGRQEIIP